MSPYINAMVVCGLYLALNFLDSYRKSCSQKFQLSPIYLVSYI